MKGGDEIRENRQVINGFFLQEALLTLVALAICAMLLSQAVEMAASQPGNCQSDNRNQMVSP